MPAARTITIYSGPRSGGFNVHEGERYTGPLSWDEMLGQLAAMTIPMHARTAEGVFGICTPDEWDARRAERERRWMPQQCDLSEPAREAVHALAREFGARGGDFDELLPAEDQPDPRVRYALLLLQACAATRGLPFSPTPELTPF